MKKLFLLVPAAALCVSLMATGEADAGDVPVVQRAAVVNPNIFKLFTTSVHGTVDMSAAKNGEYAGMTCDKLSVSATSVATNPCQPGSGFCVNSPKWTHTQTALTNGSSPTLCNYSILVPAGQAFGLSANTQVNLCGGSGLTYVTLKQTASTGQLTVPLGGSKEADLVITNFQKACIN
jgi:hypothetical protein